jgi:excisionase family DNA binding protein
MPVMASFREHKNAMTVAEVAELLSVSERQIYQMATDDEIPHFKIGSAVRFDPCLLAAWLEGQISMSSGKEPPFDPLVRKIAAEETLRRDREFGQQQFKTLQEKRASKAN